MPPATIVELFTTSFRETLLMVGVSGLIGSMVGLPAGLLLYLASHQPNQASAIQLTLRWCLNGVQSTPAIILVAAFVPLAHSLSGLPLGIWASIVPLSVISVPFIARQVEKALAQVDRELIDTARSDGASTWQLVYRVLAPQASADVAAGLGLALSSLVGYSAIAGAIGGGGLGDLGIRYGYREFIPELMLAVVIALLVLAESTHYLGRMVAARLSERKCPV